MCKKKQGEMEIVTKSELTKVQNYVFSKKKGLHSNSGFILSITCLKCLLTLGNNGAMTLYVF